MKMIKIILVPLKAVNMFAQQPILPMAALALLTYGPTDHVEAVFKHPLVQRFVRRQSFKVSLKVLLTIGIIRLLNRFSSRWARNNWRFSRQPNWEWNTEIAVVTGGCSGIGKHIAIGLAQKGIKVIILDVQDIPIDLAQIDDISFWKCDMTSSSAVSNVANEIRQSVGHPSILINNAGIVKPHPILETTEEDLTKLFGVNTFALWYTAREFLPNMALKNKGHIVTIASIASFSTAPTIVDYAASKVGALAFHEGLTGEIRHVLKAPGVITTVVHPYWTQTGMTSPYAERIARTQGRLMQAERVAEDVLGQVWRRRGGQVVIPSSLSWLSAVRGCPNWIQELLIDIVGMKLNQ